MASSSGCQIEKSFAWRACSHASFERDACWRSARTRSAGTFTLRSRSCLASRTIARSASDRSAPSAASVSIASPYAGSIVRSCVSVASVAECCARGGRPLREQYVCSSQPRRPSVAERSSISRIRASKVIQASVAIYPLRVAYRRQGSDSLRP